MPTPGPEAPRRYVSDEEDSDRGTRLAAYAVIVDGRSGPLALWNEAPSPLWTVPGGGVELAET